MAFVAAVLVTTVGMASLLGAGTAEGDGSGIQFQLYRVSADDEDQGTEPVIQVIPGDVVWVTGTGDEHAHVWHGAIGQPLAHVHQPEPPAAPGDSTIFHSSDGRMYWTGLGVLDQDSVFVAAREVDGDAWIGHRGFEAPPPPGYDRPWFFSVGASTYFYALRDPVIDVFRTQDGGVTWSPHSNIQDDDPNAHINTGQPASTSAGRVVAPVFRQDGQGGMEINAATLAPGAAAWVLNPIPGGDDPLRSLPWSAVDAADNAYVLWREAAGLGIARSLAPDGAWQGAGLLGGPGDKMWGLSAVAGAAGTLGVAWYERPCFPQLQPCLPQDCWAVKYQRVTGADGDEPEAGLAVIVDACVADADEPPVTAFADFLTIDRRADASVVIAYTCKGFEQLPGVNPTRCALDKKNPMLAVQTDGPGL